MTTRGKIRQYLIGAACAAGALMAPEAHAAGVLRVCADPDNLPFSKADGPEHGLYVELANMVARRMGDTAQYVWWLSFSEKKALRNTLLNDKCDAYFALPADPEYKAPGVQRTQAFLDMSYAIVAPAEDKINGLADLRGKRVAVLSGSAPHILLASQKGYTTSSFVLNEDAMNALDKGEVDAAILWGPSAGYENLTRFHSRWRVTPVSGEGMSGRMAVAVRWGNDALAADINQALIDLRPDIVALADKYGFPRGKPVRLASASDGSRSMHGSGANGPADSLVQARVVRAGFIKTADTTQPAAATGGDAKAGREFFNSTCAHCHSTDGASPISARDLRRLKSRYKDQWPETAETTIKNGRPDAGMPTWAGILSQKDIDDIVSFLTTIQK
ncbi:c-type cytochrome [Rhodoferax sediminis]|jgi:ABC-type amino acid transport substrate-binding protein/mono/diheme cytochrome c family protein|uniref:Transporter substrate-binding domain-containing protein n=1 Tax=Rhodoferax sediminis TaxID=2509614 RepID=A0A515D9C8_9BURK|nr:transporter substrate-binding domain-containing protein [Rhodoferax sediminis]QDL37010.1 transporter substrate-binding domain-containing protein [Rhodoferax sediminis]